MVFYIPGFWDKQNGITKRYFKVNVCYPIFYNSIIKIDFHFPKTVFKGSAYKRISVYIFDRRAKRIFKVENFIILIIKNFFSFVLVIKFNACVYMWMVSFWKNNCQPDTCKKGNAKECPRCECSMVKQIVILNGN